MKNVQCSCKEVFIGIGIVLLIIVFSIGFINIGFSLVKAIYTFNENFEYMGRLKDEGAIRDLRYLKTENNVLGDKISDIKAFLKKQFPNQYEDGPDTFIRMYPIN